MEFEITAEIECGFHKSGAICDIVNHRIMNSVT